MLLSAICTHKYRTKEKRGQNRSTHTREVNSSPGEELFKLKDNTGTKTCGYKLSMKKLQLEIRRRFLTLQQQSLETDSMQE